ncbi:hypothetical protein V5O48_004139 [Marasmius crinis-equi]|uniref:Uncharacterized protein n=1 Tax=Marasmius crinis-equi TaxID=585013 RepID=A0ABR3FQX7_9AGAR
MDMGSLRWSQREDLDAPTFLTYHDWTEAECKFETEICLAEQEFFRDRRFIDDEAEESNSLESGDEESDSEESAVVGERLSPCDNCRGFPVELVLLARTSAGSVRTRSARNLVLEAIHEEPILNRDFDAAIGMIADLCHLQATEGRTVETAALNAQGSQMWDSTRMIISSSTISCVAGSLVEVSFTLRRVVVPIVQKERIVAELVSVRVHAPPPTVEVAVGLTVELDQGEVYPNRGSKRRRVV